MITGLRAFLGVFIARYLPSRSLPVCRGARPQADCAPCRLAEPFHDRAFAERCRSAWRWECRPCLRYAVLPTHLGSDLWAWIEASASSPSETRRSVSSARLPPPPRRGGGGGANP